MTRPAAPWWLFLLAASYVAYFGLLLFCDVQRPEWIGFHADVRTTGLYVREVAAGSAADVAGFASGDRVAAAGRRSIDDRADWAAFENSIRLNTPIPVQLDRAGRRIDVTIRPRREIGSFWKTTGGLVLMIVRAAQLATLATAVLVAFRRPDDYLARLGAWLLASGSVFCIAFPAGMAAVWGSLPWLIRPLLWLPLLSSLSIGAILLTFFAFFPQPLFRDRRVVPLLWAPAAAVVGTFAIRFGAIVHAGNANWPAPNMHVVMIVAAIYGAAALGALTFNYRRLTDVNDRRRVRLIMPGSFVALIAGLVIVSSYWGDSPADITGPIFASPRMAAGAILMLHLPITFAYAILRRRLFDISTLLRQGVRYALARRFVLSLVPLTAMVLIADVVLQRSRTIDEVIAARRTAYIALIGAAVFAHRRREVWLAALDRRFFRDRYDARRVVRDIASRLREATSLEAVAPHVVAQLEAALHPQFVSLMVRRADAVAFHPIASAPAGAAPRTLPASSKLVALGRLLDGPLRLAGDDDTGLKHQLPEAERAFVREAGVDLFLPIVADGTEHEAIMLLGSKRSEEPYGEEDVELLATVRAALSRLLEHPRQEPVQSAVAEQCPACGVCYDGGTAICPRDQNSLRVTAIPRVLASRYRLDRSLGAGGMGVVYAATDTALARAVAVKLLRDEWTQSLETTDRFRREAKIAASFTHPNVVTVHDFGVDHRAFLVMEFLHGGTVREELIRSGPLSVADALRILKDACAAVHAAHERILIHGDLKPENLFVARNDVGTLVKVLDFGLATSLAHTAQKLSPAKRIFAGTPAYMAPEQLRHEEPQPSWDLWALGVVAYELLTGALPFSSAGTGWPEPFEDRLRDAALAPLRPVFARALALDPRGRHASAGAFIAEFEQAASECVNATVVRP